MSKEGKPDYSVRTEILKPTKGGKQIIGYNREGLEVAEYREFTIENQNIKDDRQLEFKFEFQHEHSQEQMELDTESEKFLENFPENWDKAIEMEQEKEKV